jgi:aspartate/methionine/tyrosine aminotransferase
MPLNAMREIEGLSYLEELAEEYEDQNGSAPFNLSHWDPSDQTVKALLKHLRLPPLPSGIPYIYSYVEGKQEVLRRLGFHLTTRRCGFVQAGTTAMLLAVWWLKALGIDRVLILCPTYFPVFYDCEVMNLNCTPIYMRREGRRWFLPRDELVAAVRESPSKTSLWVTNPVFCTGSYLHEPDVALLDSLLAEGAAVVADECLAMNGREMGGSLGRHGRFLGLYSPHKAVSINSAKFAAAVFDTEYEDFFDGWADVLAGGLSASSYSSILHFLGDNYSEFQSAFTAHVEAARERVVKVLRDHGDSFDTDETSTGHFMTCYAAKLAGDLGDDKQFLRRLVFDTGAILIPGVRNHFSRGICFNFRINLARECPQFYSALHRTVRHLTSMTSRGGYRIGER